MDRDNWAEFSTDRLAGMDDLAQEVAENRRGLKRFPSSLQGLTEANEPGALPLDVHYPRGPVPRRISRAHIPTR